MGGPETLRLQKTTVPPAAGCCAAGMLSIVFGFLIFSLSTSMVQPDTPIAVEIATVVGLTLLLVGLIGWIVTAVVRGLVGNRGSQIQRPKNGDGLRFPDTIRGGMNPVPGPDPHPRPANSMRWFLPVAVASMGVCAIAVVVFVAMQLRREKNPYKPPARESVEEKYRSASEVFSAGSGASVDLEGDQANVQEALERFVQSVKSGDAREFAAHFHLRRMLAEIEFSGGNLNIKNRREEKSFLTGLEAGVAKLQEQFKHSTYGWTKIRTVRVKLDPTRGEATAFCLVTAGGVINKFRIWLIKDDQRWKIFDFESLEDGTRYSTAFASILSSGITRPADLQRLMQATATYKQAIVLIAELRFEEGLDTLARARPGAASVLIPQITMLEGVCLASLGKYEEALTKYDTALKLKKDIPLIHHLKAVIFLEQGRYTECIQLEREYINLLGDDPEAWLQIGAAYEGLEEPDKAVEAYRKGSAIDSDEFDNRYNLAVLLLGRDRVDEAKELFLEACRNAADSQAYFDSAVSELEEAKEDEAVLDLCRDQLKRTPDYAYLYYTRGSALRRLGRYAKAEKALRTGLKKSDEETRWWYEYELALVLGHLDKEREALDLAEKIGRDQSDPQTALYLRAYIHAAVRPAAEAIKTLEKLLREIPAWSEEVEQERVFEPLLATPEGRALVDRAKEEVKYDDEGAKLIGEEKWAELLDLSRKRADAAPDDPDALFNQGMALLNLGREARRGRARAAGRPRERSPGGASGVLGPIGARAGASGSGPRGVEVRRQTGAG